MSTYTTPDGQLIHLGQAEWPAQREALQGLRKTVFVQEQGVSEAIEIDGRDDDADVYHFVAEIFHSEHPTTELALSDNQNSLPIEVPSSRAIATARLLADGKIGRMCVHPDYRQHGIGAALLKEVLRFSISYLTVSQAKLMAQTSAAGFYKKLGFDIYGSEFTEANIPHLPMCLAVNTADAAKHCFENHAYRLTGASAFARHIHFIAQDTLRTLDIFCEQLHPELFTEAICDALSHIARRHSQTTIRLLLKDTTQLHNTSHPLLRLSQRLPSSIRIKKLKLDADVNMNEGFLLGDKNKIVYLNNEKNYEGFVSYHNPAEVNHRQEIFTRLWNYQSEEDGNLRTLFI